MTALANENGAVPPQDDADSALAASMVGEVSHADLHDGRSVDEFNEVEYRQQRAEAKAAIEDEALIAAMETGDWDAFEAVRASLDNDDSDVPYAERGLDTRYGVREDHLLYGLTTKRKWLSPDDATEYERRLELSDGLYVAGWPWAGERLLIPPFTALDRQNPTSWRPWNQNLLDIPFEEGPLMGQRLTAMAKRDRFVAVLASIRGQHHDRHGFFAHPFCADCYPGDYLTVDCYFAAWMLRNGESRFPADQWDGTLPPLPVPEESVDFMTIEDLAELPEPSWLIEGVLPDSGTGILRARDQSFKSFMALDWALQVALDEGRVLYCVGEGANNFGARIDAWLEHTGADRDEVEGLDLFPIVPNLFTGGDLYERILARCRAERYDLVIIDTYVRAVAGSDLNSQGDQALVTSRIDELKRTTDGSILLVAHSQKSDQDSSGSIEIEDARDFVFAMKRSGNEVTFEVTKQKDGVESPKPLRYVAKPVGKSIVLVEAGLGGDEPLMTVKDWIFAALENTKALGPQSEADIRGWINTHDEYRRLGNKQLGKSSCSSALSRLIEAKQVVKVGARYTVRASQEDR